MVGDFFYLFFLISWCQSSDESRLASAKSKNANRIGKAHPRRLQRDISSHLFSPRQIIPQCLRIFHIPVAMLCSRETRVPRAIMAILNRQWQSAKQFGAESSHIPTTSLFFKAVDLEASHLQATSWAASTQVIIDENSCSLCPPAVKIAGL